MPPTLRAWRETDLAPFAAMNADPAVMRHMLAAMTRDESAAMLSRLQATLAERGWGIWAIDVDGKFAGMVGLNVPRWPLPFSPCTEILWRLRSEFWGRGIAYAAACAALERGFGPAGIAEIVAFTTPGNTRSIRLMDRLGFRRDLAGDFDHPAVPAGHPLRRHVLYRMDAATFRANPPNRSQRGDSSRTDGG